MKAKLYKKILKKFQLFKKNNLEISPIDTYFMNVSGPRPKNEASLEKSKMVSLKTRSPKHIERAKASNIIGTWLNLIFVKRRKHKEEVINNVEKLLTMCSKLRYSKYPKTNPR